jgi:nitrogen fixation/metabolism regulation signal transduction histidine kinase
MVDKLEASVAQLARSEREYAWREMARQIAHEIKNPLTPMKLNIQFLLRTLEMESSEKFEQRFREVSQLLIEQIDNMATTAAAFSDFAKISSAHNEVFEVDELLRNCVELFRNNIDVVECDLEENLCVFGDKGQFRRVIINLLKNAEQSVPQEEKSIISISAKQVDEQIEIRIRDNGCGISPEISEKIFEPNFTTKSSGSGLGLAICRRIIEEFDGKIGFITEQDSGTEFFIILKRYQESEGLDG